MSNGSHFKWGPVHTNDNVLCAIDIRVGGNRPSVSDLLEVTFLPLNHSYKLSPEMKMFQVKIRPSWKVDNKFAGLNATTLKDYTGSSFDSVSSFALFERWVVDTLELKPGKKIMPLVWDWSRVRPYLQNWMGDETFDYYMHESVRDGMTVLNFLNDRWDFWGESPEFKAPTFGQFIVRSGIELIEKNSVTANAMALIEVYRQQLGKYIPGYKAT